MTFTGKITPDAEGRFWRMEFDLPTGQQVFEREGAQVRFTHKEVKRTFTLRQDAVPFENMSPAFMSLAVRRYDRAAGGQQTMPLLMLNALAVMDGSLEFLDSVERSVGGRDLKLDRYKFAIPGVDLTVWADETGKVYFVDVPAQRAYYVREGYEELHAAEEDDPKLSQPVSRSSKSRGVEVLMRDGVKP